MVQNSGKMRGRRVTWLWRKTFSCGLRALLQCGQRRHWDMLLETCGLRAGVVKSTREGDMTAITENCQMWRGADQRGARWQCAVLQRAVRHRLSNLLKARQQAVKVHETC